MRHTRIGSPLTWPLAAVTIAGVWLLQPGAAQAGSINCFINPVQAPIRDGRPLPFVAIFCGASEDGSPSSAGSASAGGALLSGWGGDDRSVGSHGGSNLGPGASAFSSSAQAMLVPLAACLQAVPPAFHHPVPLPPRHLLLRRHLEPPRRLPSRTLDCLMPSGRRRTAQTTHSRVFRRLRPFLSPM